MTQRDDDVAKGARVARDGEQPLEELAARLVRDFRGRVDESEVRRTLRQTADEARNLFHLEDPEAVQVVEQAVRRRLDPGSGAR